MTPPVLNRGAGVATRCFPGQPRVTDATALVVERALMVARLDRLAGIAVRGFQQDRLATDTALLLLLPRLALGAPPRIRLRQYTAAPNASCGGSHGNILTPTSTRPTPSTTSNQNESVGPPTGDNG